MKARETIKTIGDWISEETYKRKYNKTEIVELSEALINLKCMTEQQGNSWIPVSERLPNMEECQKNDCRFIVTDGDRVYEDSFDYMADGYMQPYWTYSTMCQPTAWMPLPESYKE